VRRLNKQHEGCGTKARKWKAQLGHPHRTSRAGMPRQVFLGGNRVIFNIKGNSYRLVVKVRFQNGIVMIEWGGTHAEYDKKNFGQ
jgi:mRNA-degrading endonuclease HigB of HigAB toxin-antitoxin module